MIFYDSTIIILDCNNISSLGYITLRQIHREYYYIIFLVNIVKLLEPFHFIIYFMLIFLLKLIQLNYFSIIILIINEI
jgi:hypothetical protein